MSKYVLVCMTASTKSSGDDQRDGPGRGAMIAMGIAAAAATQCRSPSP
jgi:hypothetical protein